MVRFLAIVSLCLIGLNKTATAAVYPLPAGLQYSEQVDTELPKIFNIEAALEKQKFTRLEFAGEAYPLRTIDWVDRIFVSSDGAEVIFLKANIKPSRKINYNTVYALGNEFVVHLPGDNNFDHALYFSGYSAKSVNKILEKLSKNIAKTDAKTDAKFQNSSLNLLSFIIPKAHADGMCSPSERSPTENKMAAGLGALAMGCIKSLGSGFYNSTAGVVVTGVEGAIKVVSDPAGAFRSVRDSYRTMVNFVSDFTNSMGSLKDDFLALPSDIKAKVFCEVIGALAGAGTMAIFTAGLSSGAVAAVMAKALAAVNTTLNSAQVAKLATAFATTAKGIQLKRSAQAGKFSQMVQLERRIAEAQVRNNKIGGKLSDINQGVLKVPLEDEQQLIEAASLNARYIKSEQVKLSELQKEIASESKSSRGSRIKNKTEEVTYAATLGCANIQSLAENFDAREKLEGRGATVPVENPATSKSSSQDTK